MNITSKLKQAAAITIKELYAVDISEHDILVNATKPEFEGDYTIVLFALIKQLKKSPEVLGKEIGEHITQNNTSLFASYNIIKGFLNLVIADSYWVDFLQANYANTCFGTKEKNGKSDGGIFFPNTNKPLHLGHLRNNFLGWSIAEIYKANGYDTTKTCIVNDRGVHICKSMIAWQMFGNGATPQSTNTKGDHFVGDYYVKFNDELKRQTLPIYNDLRNEAYSNYNLDKLLSDQISTSNAMLESYIKKLQIIQNEIDYASVKKVGLRIQELCEQAKEGQISWSSISKGFSDEEFNNLSEKELDARKKELSKLLKEILECENGIETHKTFLMGISNNLTPIMKATQQMLLDWEAGNPSVMELWKEMNSWVYSGFDITYKLIGSDFDKTYYESNTYLLGKKIVEEGLTKGVFVQEEDNSVWIDLTNDGLDKKIVQRKDGTSVYITQDIGLAEQKFEEYGCDKSIYVIGDEQNYHMKVLKLICQKLQLPSADGIEHLSYGMVELPTGKMKSREGTVVDADDIVDEMISISKQRTEELGKVKDFTAEELETLYRTIGLGALKFFLLRVDPRKKMIFNPEESIDFQGFTGTFIQFTYARIKSILRKVGTVEANDFSGKNLSKLERDLIIHIEQFEKVVEEAATEQDPSKIAIYVFDISKLFSSFLNEHSIANAESEEKKILRIQIAQITSSVIKTGMHLLGIEVPERM